MSAPVRLVCPSLNTRYTTASTDATRAGSSARPGTSYGSCRSSMVRLARTIRCAIVVSGARNARAISPVEKPAMSLSVSATWLSRGSAGWQQVKMSRS